MCLTGLDVSNKDATWAAQPACASPEFQGLESSADGQLAGLDFCAYGSGMKRYQCHEKILSTH